MLQPFHGVPSSFSFQLHFRPLWAPDLGCLPPPPRPPTPHPRSPTPSPSLVLACFLWRGPLTALSVLGLNCVPAGGGWARAGGIDSGLCVSVCALECV